MKKMKVIVSAFGTRGDVQPAIVLAKEALQRGHEVVVVVSRGMEELPKTNSVPYEVYSGDTAQKQFGALGGNSKAGGELFKRVKEHFKVQADELVDICKDADVLIGNCLDPFAISVAEYCNIPFVRLALTPIWGRENRPSTLPIQKLPKWGNKMLWGIGTVLWEMMFKPPINATRKSLGLASISSYKEYMESVPTLLGLDKRLAPSAPQWPSNIQYTGYPFYSPKIALSSRVKQFLLNGDVPIYIGFGSMGGEDPEKIIRVIRTALNKTNTRAIVHKGWAKLTGFSDSNDVLEIDYEPHHLLFKEVAGVVHHGGAGTTHTAALAGCPQLLIPHITDQFYYGQSVVENQLGPLPIPYSKLSSLKLSKGILELTKEKYSQKAKMFSDFMGADGDIKCVDFIEQCIVKSK